VLAWFQSSEVPDLVVVVVICNPGAHYNISSGDAGHFLPLAHGMAYCPETLYSTPFPERNPALQRDLNEFTSIYRDFVVKISL
jgi:hypothetical protein